MTPEEIQKSAQALNERMEAFEAKQANLTEKLDGLKGFEADKVKAEIEAVVEKQTELAQEYKNLSEAQNERMDDLEKELKRKHDIDASKGTVREKLRASVEDNAEAIKALKDGEGSVKLTLKADMSIGSDLTGDVIAPDRFQGIYADPLRSTHVRDFMTVTTTNSNSIRYMTESSYNDTAATRAEAATAAQSDTNFVENSVGVENISTYLTLSREMFDDLGFITSYIQSRVIPRLLNKEDNELLYGTGTTPSLDGITTNAAAWSDNLADSNVNRADVLRAAATQTHILEYMPNLHLVHPNDFQNIELIKDSQGAYILPGALSGQVPTIGGARVVANTAVTSGDHITGDFRLGATLALREDVTIEMTTSHASQFTARQITIMINERIANVIHNANAFSYGNFTTSLAKGSA